MAENDTDQERTERPTARRLQEAREEGQVPRSAELNTAAVLLAAAGSLHFLGGSIGARLLDIMKSGLSFSPAQAVDPGLALSAASAELLRALIVCAPVLGVTLIAALFAPMALGGWNLSLGALVPDFTRLDPIAGLGRVFCAQGAVELGKALAKFLVVTVIAIAVLHEEAPQLLALGTTPLHAGIAQAADLTSDA
ncbi:MAG: EscU/YscU/HrcU family type III secretion system export apparatus switch protein, partial [Steroidobacteraceae bacterium]